MNRLRGLLTRGVWPSVVAIVLVLISMRPGPRPSGPVTELGQAPRLMPALEGVVLAPNIAAPGLRVNEPGTAWYVTLRGARGQVAASGRRQDLRFAPRLWQRLLATNRGAKLTLTVYVRRGGTWTRYAPVDLSVAAEPVDRYLVYRLLTPLYNLARDVGIYERDLTGYRERVVMRGRQTGGCVNCHSFWQGSGQRFTLGVRSSTFGGRTLLVNGRSVVPLKQPIGYGSWHPDGRIAVYSSNQVRQFFHAAGEETRDVFDLSSGLTVFDAGTRSFSTTPELSAPDYLYTYPCWAPDGKTLYFARARRTWPGGELIPPPGYDQVRYNLMRIAYDPCNGAWGKAEVLLSGETAKRSYVFPRVSPDGRWLLYTACDYGCFPIHRPNSDLGLIDLRSGQAQPVPINSDRADTWHSWSSNGRWVVFASKRADGLFTKLYLSYFDTDGRLHPPLLLPQSRADYYDMFWHSYNVPEFVTQPVRASAGQLGRAARSRHAAPAPLPPELAQQAPSMR
ncbi:MAG: PD40 domain-containing protein [Armatimonadetes bacterium]|nr:PD40 domain-containing protein [Armatimonadota bacterium]